MLCREWRDKLLFFLKEFHIQNRAGRFLCTTEASSTGQGTLTQTHTHMKALLCFPDLCDPLHSRTSFSPTYVYILLVSMCPLYLVYTQPAPEAMVSFAGSTLQSQMSKWFSQRVSGWVSE